MPLFTGRRFLFSVSGTVNSTACLAPECMYPPYVFPSPPIPSIPTEDPDPITIDIKHSNRLLPNFLIAAASVLALSFFLLLLFYFLLRLRRRRRRQLLHNHVVHPDAGGIHPLQTGNLNVAANPFEDSFDGTHHIWFIKTVGLDESLIKSIGSRVYKPGDDLEDCSVCLGEFKDGETLKVLPRCKHWFHVECVDTWLKAHVNCPLCRAPVLGDEVKLNELEDGNIEIVSIEQSQERHDGSSSSSSSCRGNGSENENEMQPTRRSVSMDASGLGGMLMIMVDLENRGKTIEKETELENVNNTNDVREMQRSMSCRSGRLFFPRYGRGRSTSVLPL